MPTNMKDEEKMLTQRRRGAEGENNGSRLASKGILCVSAPLREIICACVIIFAGQSLPGADDVPSVELTATSWPLGRGNSLAAGVAKTVLPEKPEVVWKVTIDKGAFDGTPVIADGVVYLGDMDGKVFAWKLADGKELWSHKVESGFIASPAVRGGLLYIGDIDGKFYALDSKTGQPKWTFSAE